MIDFCLSHWIIRGTVFFLVVVEKELSGAQFNMGKAGDVF